jgi:hypothetical protein
MSSNINGPEEVFQTPPMGSATPEHTIEAVATQQLEPAVHPLSATGASLAARDSHEFNGRLARGVILAIGAAGVTAAILAGSHTDGKVSRDLPFSEKAQEMVEGVDTALEYAGAVLLPASLAAAATVKVGAKYNSRMRSMDKLSSKELKDDGKTANGMLKRGTRNILTKYLAGGIPVVATGAVIVGANMAAVGEEISDGPSRPIEAMFDAMPGDGPYSIIVQDKTANPMLQSDISRPLVSNVLRAAAVHGVQASPVDLYLPSITHDGQDLTSLVIAFPQKPDSDLAYAGDTIDCDDVPVTIDKSANIPVGDHLEINGTSAVVVGETTNTSAINRVGIQMDREAVAACMKKMPHVAPDSMVILGSDASTAQQILQEANVESGETASVMTEQQYIESSQNFWEANSKPITNVLALMSTALAFISMDNITHARMLRNRTEWATKLAMQVAPTQMRMTELLRAAKDGSIASIVGVGAATVIAPAINFLESGLRVGMDFRSAMVGCAVGILGSVGGTLHRVLRPRRTINVSEDTRI